jgi:hypothetical protein
MNDQASINGLAANAIRAARVGSDNPRQNRFSVQIVFQKQITTQKVNP